MNEHSKEILNIEEACRLLGVSPKTFAKILREGEIPGRKIGREWKFSRQAIIDWVGSARSGDFVGGGGKERSGKDGTGPSLRGSRKSLPGQGGRTDRFSVEED